MRVIHRLVGYDKQTDRPKQRFDIPEDRLSRVKQIARVHEDDPDAVWSYSLSAAQAREVVNLVGAQLELQASEFFLEAFADPAPPTATE